ncbi:hypothetical protein WQ57_23130 [Mesobacillus campisalis]|uniref:Alcohol dehydrogenase-like C-terminal domain-containing protein n=1 Tax=Mesobacillus campisalis TaxID=1408103 RepID=A0A0M2SIC5_9BACI|nr:hypothetical protein [Mesobacillus campisalis]KKK34444.1 hypothetical protein WQ57_23130 [Mesobacillus campisalis]
MLKKVEDTIFLHIIRGVNWLGIDSVECPMEKRLKVWNRLGDDSKPTKLNEDMVNEVSLKELPGVLADILEGKVRGRTIVKL